MARLRTQGRAAIGPERAGSPRERGAGRRTSNGRQPEDSKERADHVVRTTFADGAAWKAVAVRRVGLDDYSQVRYLHARAMRTQCGDALSDGELGNFLAFVESPAFSDHLRTEEVHGAFLDGQLIGTASWLANADDGETARIASVFVHPMFARLGLGGRLLAEVEGRAVQSGFDLVGASSILSALPFFERYGYMEASRGVRACGPECWLPVAFLRKRISRGLA